MRWRRLRSGSDGDQAGHARADAAIRRADAQLEDSRRKEAAASRLARRIREMRKANHLAEAIEKALEEGRRQ